MAKGKDIRAGRAFVEFAINRAAFERQLKQVGQSLQRLGARVSSIGGQIAAAGAGIAAPFVASLAIFQRVGDRLDKLAQRTGISVEALSQLGFAAEQSGSSLASVEKAVRTMQRAIVDLGRGLSTQTFAFEQLGLVYQDIERLSPEQQFTLIADRIASIEDPTKRVAAALQIFGRSGQELVPLLNQGAGGIAALRAEAERLGITIDTKTAKSAAEFGDALNRLRQQVKATAINIGAALGPAITRVSGVLSSLAPAVIDFARSNQRLIQTVAAVGGGLIAVGVSLVALGTTIGLVGFAITSLAGVIAAVMSPLGLLAAGLAAGGVAFVRFSEAGQAALDFLRGRFRELLGIAQESIQGIGDALAGNDIQLAARILWASLKLIFYEGAAPLIDRVIQLRASILRSLTEITLGGIAIGSELYAGMQRIFINIASVAIRAFENIRGAVKEAFNLMRLQAVKAGNAIRGALDGDFNVDAMNARAENDFAQRQQQEQNRQKTALANIEEEKAAKLKYIEEEKAARDQAIASALRDELAAIEAGRTADAERIRDYIAGLKEQREELLKQAELQRKLQEGRDLFFDFFRSGAPGVAGGDQAEQLRNATKSLGVTSSFDIRSVGALPADGIERVRQVNEKLLREAQGISNTIKQALANGAALVT